jgi:predicted RND superfamily exporter protein
MILFSLFELIVDDILKVDFRSVQWAVVPYVMFFFAATGGMIGVAAQAGKQWSIVTSVIFLIMAALAFVQRGITGL